MEIITGKIQKAKKVVIYGSEGIGKSTFAAQFPNPIFIDTEGSTNGMNVARTPKPTSWEILNNYVRELKTNNQFNTIVVDTIDWAEQLCIESVCSRFQKSGIEDFGYGNGYVYEKEDFGKFLNLLQDVVDSGINVVLTAHAQLKKFEQPDELGAYDRWELKLGKKTGSQISPLVKEWADMVLFANYKTYAVSVDKDGKKFKAQGGERIMYTTHHPCWDAKNRDGLEPEISFEYKNIAHLFENTQSVPQIISATEKSTVSNLETVSTQIQISAEKELPPQAFTADLSDFEEICKPLNIPDYIPKPLADLMLENNVDEADIRLVVSQRGYYTQDTPINKYSPDFVSGCLVVAWSKMLPLIKENQAVPFE